ncbi:regulator of chromosome condensation 1/beta-lactamase-inhibitor protein II [Lipomyces kononenkoae]|uniref:Regulator of chromosome condensation 1/beta-lactamase-inhibitor protein II n=1 Tax=Lipomyces kononenkoae TaxID=34357 RepID=A0ACC3SYV5_LIPKO
MTNATSRTFSLFSFGSNAHCQLSHSSAEDIDEPTRVAVSLPSPVSGDDVAVSSNGNHTLLLISGQVYATGDNTYGQCFVSPSSTGTRRLSTFHKIDNACFGGRPRFIAAGWDFSVVITSLSTHDEIYVAGHGPRGQLGIDESITVALTPQHIRDFPPLGRRVRQICAGMGHAVVLLDDGSVYGWGQSRKGQLGPANTLSVACWTPTRVDFCNDDGFVPAKLVCGREFSAAIDTAGKVIVLHSGKDIHGIRNVPGPETVAGWTDFQSGWTTLHVLLDSGDVVSWGNNSHCQHVPKEAATLPFFVRISCGSEHTLALGRHGKVYAWGWGEHGNCGRLEGDEVNVRRARPVFGADANEIVYLGAGCATSWIGSLS